MTGRTNDVQHDSFWAPGTVNLEELQEFSNKIILHPIPTSDPNDPLNWSTKRKCVNFALVSFYVLMTFVQLDIGYTAWGQYQHELGFSVSLLNGGVALQYAGLAIGCFFFVPLVHKYGRRPSYIVSTVIQLASCVWFASMKRPVDLWISSLLSGLGGATSETIVQITIADLFFVHNHAALNGCYLLFVAVGAFLGPVASGYIVDNQGWRWIWWWCVILFGVGLIFTVLLFEESKYTPVLEARVPCTATPDGVADKMHIERKKTRGSDPPDASVQGKYGLVERTQSNVLLDETIPLKSYRQRLAFITNTEGPILHHLFQPITAPWPLLAVGFGLFGFNLGVTGSIALSYAMDCYHDVIGNALVGVVFTRNVLSVVVLFSLSPWIDGMGLRDMHILVSAVSFCILLIPVLLLIWGKKSRASLATRYREMARKQPTHRGF
ncbi:MFS general substrate transporter [Purpureocillium lilacinum]|uniref:MFS general substrate transporter n=1 Tax=Purpureocillium lilacinum TaxID=33203 RepID=A0A179FEY1_PURLI|nr:MFS general substrate transporter [Purpureocillium lilacinum]OAQ63957.1 MFS general substrate transporter [Purpureocillium lilacinum]